MSSRGASIAVLIAALGVVLYLLVGREGSSDSPGEAPAAPARDSEVSPGSGPARASGSTDRAEQTRVVLRGRVQTAGEGTPVAGAVITVTPAEDEEDTEEPRSVLSDAEGRFELSELVPGRYAVSATAAGHLPAVQRRVEVETDASVTLTLTPGGHPIRGVVSDATGGVIEGALVRLTPVSGVVALRRLDGFGTLCAEDGTYAVHVAPGRYRMDVSHPDYATDTRTVEVGAGPQTQDFALVPMGVIEGVVRQREGGEAVPGAWVSWQRERQETIVPGHRMARVDGSGMVRADDQGRFVVRGLSPGAISLRARAPGAASEAPRVVPLAMAEHVTDVEVRVASAEDLRGRVVAKDDPEQGIAGATVTLVPDERGGPRATTDAEGRFVLTGVLSGSYAVMARASGWGYASAEVVIGEGGAEGGPEPILLELEEAPAIRGRVEPPTAARVSIEMRAENMRMGMGRGGGMLLMASGNETETGEDGRFELEVVAPGPTTVVARVADGRAGETTVEVGPDGVDEVVVRLEPRSTVRGEVRNASGDAVPQANVSLTRAREPGAPEFRLTVNGRDMGAELGTTTEDGRFEIGGVAAGDYEVQVTDRHGEPLPIEGGTQGRGRLTVSKGADVQGYVIRVDTYDGVIQGVVHTADGEPVPDVWVQATLVPDMRRPEPPEPDEGNRSRMEMVIDGDGSTGSRGRPPVLTDDEGRFEFVGLRDASYELIAEGGGGRQRVTKVARPGDEVTLALAELGTIEGQATLDGQPLTSFSLSVEGPASHSMHVRDSGGHFEIGRLDPGTYRVVVRTPEGSGHGEVTLAAGQTARQDIALEHLVAVTGRIMDDQGAPVVGAVIMLGEGSEGKVSIESDGEQEQHTTDEEGRFEVTCAPGSRALLALSPASPQPLVVHFFVVEPGQDVDLGELQARERTARMETMEQVEGEEP